MRPKRLLRPGPILFTLSALLILIGVAITSRPEVALAHPLGNFTINRYSRIELGPGEIQLRYVLDMAEIPTFQEIAKNDLDQDGRVGDEVHAAYLAETSDELLDGLYLYVNDSPVPLQIVSQELSFPPGQGRLPTLRLSLLINGQFRQRDQQGEQSLYFRDDNYSERLGWKEIVLKPGEGVSLLHSTVPQHDQTNELRTYPQDTLSSPLNQREARSTFALVSLGQTSEAQPASVTAEPVKESNNILTSLVTAEKLSLTVIVLSLMVALGLGALHAISPGHGKTIMAAYLVGTRGTAKHALFLGFTVTISHTVGVLVLGLVVLYASHLIAPERLYPWLSLISGTVIVAIGIWLLIPRIRRNQGSRHAASDQMEPASRTDSHPQIEPGASRLARYYRRVRETGMMVHGHSHAQQHVHADQASRDSVRLRITWKSLTALGIVGGLVPSASAIVIFLAAISLNRIEFGLLLILAFSAGMAGVLAGVGLVLVYAGRVVERFRFKNRLIGSFTRLLPLATALVVLVSGLVVAMRGVFQVSPL